MKGISPMIATVLLLAFTVAIGGIISVWLTGMTRTQTAGVTTATQCSSTRLDVSASIINTASGNVTVTYTNLGPEVVYPMNVTLTCGANTNTTWASEIGSALNAGFTSQKSMVLVGGVCGTGNISVKVTAKCGSDQKGTVFGECSTTNC